MLTLVSAVTALVVMLNVALVAPAATVTLAGTDAAGLLLVSVTCWPPAGAGPFSVTVPVAEAPPVKLVGLSASAEIIGVAAAVGTRVARHRSTSTVVPESRNG